MGKKIKILCTVPCPYCEKPMDVIKETEITVPAEPAEKIEKFYATKHQQTKLET